ncbi:hypothetical protein VNO78_00374 [Psophocarpus tetragonolobus]|uniref:Uncharacterized protein n=1 Tax=Psophocarpus tetragonolobus TaxID=3891 RepID=A0AAN9SX01_PSOTE
MFLELVAFLLCEKPNKDFGPIHISGSGARPCFACFQFYSLPLSTLSSKYTMPSTFLLHIILNSSTCISYF